MQRVTSADGTPIAYDRMGEGPPLVLLHGGLNDRMVWAPVIPLFAEVRTVYAVDRRGRGESGPPAEHALERQFEDVLAVIDAAGEPADVVGHSYGALTALGAAALAPDRVRRLVMYEPGRPDESATALIAPFETREPADAIGNFLSQAFHWPEEQVAAFRESPFFRYMLTFVPSFPPEMRAYIAHGFDAARYASLDVPALMLSGSDSPDELKEVMRELTSHMPRTEWFTFEGHAHTAQMSAPHLFVDAVMEFLVR
jgi:pimeloyl-ACP methyl ester carboxylesterase